MKPYYELIGFDFTRDDWEAVSRDFVNIYNDLSKDVELTPGIIPRVGGDKEKGYSTICTIGIERRFVDRNVRAIWYSGIF